jgi:hypothetical protein
MTYLLAIMASPSTWNDTITPESSIVPYHWFSAPVSLLGLPNSRCPPLTRHCGEGYSKDTAQMNAWKWSYAYDIALSTSNLAAASSYNQISWEITCPSGGFATYRDSYFSLIDNKLSMTPCNSAVTLKVANLSSSADCKCFFNSMRCSHLNCSNIDA